jgi:iron(II)-dependent oxidoreductase
MVNKRTHGLNMEGRTFICLADGILLFWRMFQYICFILLWILGSSGVNAQQLESLELGKNPFTIVSFNSDINVTESLPVISFRLNNEVIDVSDLIPDRDIQISWVSQNLGTRGFEGNIQFKNMGKDTIAISNVVPFGENPGHTYITGKGGHRLSRTHLFRPEVKPVNVIVPDNAWELGYASITLGDDLSACGLARRKEWDGAVKRRFETLLAPGGSVTYVVYMDLFNGVWQEGLRKIFQDRYLYDIVDFDNSLYEREDLKWIRDAYVIHLMMSWDVAFYEEGKGYQLTSFLEKGKQLYGGDDVIGLWPTWPTLGVDQRNQFDLFRDLPGGLERIKELGAESKAFGTELFLCYNPWDESSRDENHYSGMADLIANTRAKGMVLDTKGESSKELQDAADDVQSGVIMYSEGMAVPKDMQGIVSGRVHNALYYAPFLNLNKFIKPEFSIFRVAEIFKEPIQREFAIAFFNGHGTELNIFAPGKPSWVEEQYGYLGRTSRILREHTDNFNAKDYVPLIPTLSDDIYVNKWPLGKKTVYTVFSLIPEGFKEPLFEVEPDQDHHFVDVWHHKELSPKEQDGSYYIEVETDAFNASYLGTNNEGEVDCIVQFPRLLQTTLEGDILNVMADQGDVLKIWAGEPEYDKEPLQLTAGSHQIHLLDAFGRYEGKFVVQLFEKDILIDETVHAIKAGTPRLASTSHPIFGKRGKGMVTIPSGEFIFKGTHGDAFIPYPEHREGKQFDMKGFYMDKYPVTNNQFKEFMGESGYSPVDTLNFLKHWVDGKVPEGKEDFPVVYISYEDAKAYAKWAGKRLPTELEWQYAAQTPDLREWPWGNGANVYRKKEKVTETLTTYKIQGIDPAYCNLGNGKLDEVGSYPKGKNPYGLEDLVGSVWQLTNDLYKNGSYDYILMKGGSFYNPSSSWWYVQGGPRELSYRQHLLRVSQGFERNATVGFRCVRDRR